MTAYEMATSLEFRRVLFRSPALRDGPWFNLSHSGPIALYAFSSAREIGRASCRERVWIPAMAGVLKNKIGMLCARTADGWQMAVYAGANLSTYAPVTLSIVY